MSSIEGIRQRLESLFAGVADAIPATGPLDQAAIPREVSRPRGWVWELDLEGNYTWCSPEIERILGYSRDEVQGKSFHSIGFESQSAQTVQSQLEAGKTIQQLILEAQHKDGRSFQILIRAMHRVDATGERLGYRGVTQLIDIETVPSERMAVQIPTPAEQIDATTPPSYVPSWGDLLGFEDTEGEIQPLEDTKDPRDLLSKEQLDHLVIPLQVQDEIIGVIELDSKQEGGSWDEDDRALANAIAHELAITLQDARSYQLTQQALEEMREADRLKSQFLANMSHELRTPLNSIIGFSRVILKGIDGPVTETQEQDLNAIYNAGQHLLGLINNILDISKIEAGKMELAFTDVDLSEIIRGVMATAVGLVKDKPIELITDIPEQLPFVQADNIRIRQVLLNLVSNAAKFTEEGHIGVSARTIQRGARNEVVIAVFDTGPGINQEDQERIFEPFSQVDASPTRKTGGTGLGLSISRHLVELHGGVIWVESIPDEGSTFAFTLPFNPELQISRSSAPLILGVDHDPSSLLLYREVLENSGYRFHALTRPDQSAEVANTLQPKAILLDIADDQSTPWLIISSLVKESSLRDLPILLSTLEERSEQGILFPVMDWITVPFSDDELCSWIEQLPHPEKGKPNILVIEQDPTWTRILTAVESHQCADLEHTASLVEIEDILHECPPDAVLMNLALQDQLSLEALTLLRKAHDIIELPILGMLPKQLTEDTLDALNTLFKSLDAKETMDRHSHLDRILSCLKEKVPINA
jgi:PAS domain S-box-containing protein